MADWEQIAIATREAAKNERERRETAEAVLIEARDKLKEYLIETGSYSKQLQLIYDRLNDYLNKKK